jgi:GTP cyclohydrolase II
LEKAKIKKKNILYNICATILDFYGNGKYKVLIGKDYDEYNLKKFNISIVPNNLIKKVNYKTWFEILNK